MLNNYSGKDETAFCEKVNLRSIECRFDVCIDTRSVENSLFEDNGRGYQTKTNSSIFSEMSLINHFQQIIVCLFSYNMKLNLEDIFSLYRKNIDTCTCKKIL